MVQDDVLEDGFGGRGKEAVAHEYVETLKGVITRVRSAVGGAVFGTSMRKAEKMAMR